MLWTCSRDTAPSQRFGTTCCSRRGSELMYTWEMSAISHGKKYSRSTNTNLPTATKVTVPVPTDVSQMSSNVSKTETVENDSYQNEQDQECDGNELFAVKGRGKGGFKGNFLQVRNERTQG